MTTSEKRAAMAAEGVPWPECCGEPMAWQRNLALTEQGRFVCQVDRRRLKTERRIRLKAEGRCINCGGPAETVLYCRRCADYHAAFMSTPRQKEQHRRHQAQTRQRDRAAEGFRPTGAGLAAFAAYRQHPTGEV